MFQMTRIFDKSLQIKKNVGIRSLCYRLNSTIRNQVIEFNKFYHQLHIGLGIIKLQFCYS